MKNGATFFGQTPVLFKTEYVTAVLNGEAQIPNVLTPHGERVLISEAFGIVKNMLSTPPYVFVGVFNFINWLDRVHPSNSDLAQQMQIAISEHPNFIMYYAPHLAKYVDTFSVPRNLFVLTADGKVSPDTDAKYAIVISDDFMRNIIERRVPVPDMPGDVLEAFSEAMGNKVASYLLHVPDFCPEVRMFVRGVQDEKERKIAEKIVRKMSTPEFCEKLAQNPRLMSYILGFGWN